MGATEAENQFADGAEESGDWGRGVRGKANAFFRSTVVERTVLLQPVFFVK